MIQEKRDGGLSYFTAASLEGEKNIRHLFTSRRGGVSKGHLASLNLGFSLGDDRENVVENYRRVCAVLGVGIDSIVPAKQVHKDAVRVVTIKDTGKFPPEPSRPDCDALITRDKGVTLAAFYADCSTALFYDPVRRVIAAAHAGWRGTALAVYRKTVYKMRTDFLCSPGDILVAFSPSIGPCCFETDSDVPEALVGAFAEKAAAFIEKRGNKYHVDLTGINKMLLMDAGVSGENITVSGHCTGCETDLFWSHRKTGGKRGVSGAFIAMV